MRDKVQLTKTLLSKLVSDPDMNYKKALHTWWFNLRKNGGMRLTSVGYSAFCKNLDLAHYEFVIDNPLEINQQIILSLDRKMQMPYYIHAVKGIPKKIIFFGSREAVMVNLYGNLQQFLDNYQP
jgi:hypothetical protein